MPEIEDLRAQLVEEIKKPKPAPQKRNEPVGVIKEAVEKHTKDMYLAAALHVEGCKYIRVDRADPTRQVFYFEGGDLADRVEQEYRQGTHVASTSSYAASIRMIKSLIHS